MGSEYSTAIYAELYNGSDSAGGQVRNAGVANAGYEEGDDERSEGSTNSENSGSGGSGVNKKVKFNESVAVKVRKSRMLKLILYHEVRYNSTARIVR